jgi:hypothetical protein
MKIEDFSLLMLNAVNVGVAKAIAESGVISPLISNADAYRIYVRSNVDRWLTEHQITPLSAPRKGSKRFLDRTKLNGIAATSSKARLFATGR